jgi:hypothetical protein
LGGSWRAREVGALRYKGGHAVLADPMPGTMTGIVLQSLRFVLVIVARALMPAPVRSAGIRGSAPVALAARST